MYQGVIFIRKMKRKHTVASLVKAKIPNDLKAAFWTDVVMLPQVILYSNQLCILS